MYIPGRLRTASNPSRIWIELASYDGALGVVVVKKDAPYEARARWSRPGSPGYIERGRSRSRWLKKIMPAITRPQAKKALAMTAVSNPGGVPANRCQISPRPNEIIIDAAVNPIVGQRWRRTTLTL